MSGHIALYVDSPVTSSVSGNCVEIGSSSHTLQVPALNNQAFAGGSVDKISSGTANNNCQVSTVVKDEGIASEEWKIETSGQLKECRICQEEDEIGNLEAPCACSGSLKFAHRKCVQHWCNEKGDTLCEICRQPYESGYTAPPRPVRQDGVSIDIGANWRIAGGQQIDLHQPQLYAVAAERHFLDADYEEYGGANASSAACLRSAALILMALLLLRHTLLMTSTGGDEDVSTFFMLFILKAVSFLLPCYIMARAMNVLQRRRQRQEAVMAAAEVAYLLQTRQPRGVRFAVPPGILPA